MENLDIITQILAPLIGIYEILSRVVPTTRRWSIVGNVLKFIHQLSDWLDNKKKQTT